MDNGAHLYDLGECRSAVDLAQKPVTCLHKKSSFAEPKNYRPISTMANLSRIIPVIILDRARDAYSRLLGQCQCGFRPGMGCDDAIFTLRNVVERTGQSGVLIFIDLTSAYDTLPRCLMFRLMSLRLDLPHFVELPRAVYTNTTAVIKGSKKSFKVARGCRQGGLESPGIFNAVFDSVCRVIHRKLIDELGNGYGLQLDYQIPIEATDALQK